MVERDPNAPAPTPEVPDPLLGKVLHDRFRIVERLGAGGMGTVYKAIQTPLERIVALKILNPNYGAGRDPGFQKRFFLEASVTSKLKHPNTITVIDYGKTDDGIFYIAMEYVEGVTLSEVLKNNGPLPWPRALHIAQQICRSVREAHRAGIIHRDLKPANVMVLHEETDHDLVKVLDFGLVKSFSAEKPQDEAELTQAGVFLGSPQYVAPEQARNHADPRSDIYSLGVILYAMLMGRLPFTASQTVDLLVQHLREPPPPFRTLRPEIDVPPEVEALVMKCLAKNPDERFPNMDALLEGMRKAAAGQSGVFSGVYSTATPPPITRTDGLVIKAAPEANADTVALGPGILPDSKKPARMWMAVAAGASVLLGAAVVVAIQRPAAPAPVPASASVATPVPAAVQPPTPPVPVQTATTPTTSGVTTGAAASTGTTVPPPPDKPAPLPQPVIFRIDSAPSGAKLLVDGQPLGKTPLTFTRAPDGNGIARASLTFELDGYRTATAVASGAGPEVQLRQPLHKKPHRRRAGYKDDPYQ